jgi:hypothetical protein
MRPQDEPIFRNLTEAQLMGLCIEREAGGEPRDGQIAVGTVILERVDHRAWDGKTIKEVILKPWQFSWTMPEAGEAYYEEAIRLAEKWPVKANGSLADCFFIASMMILGDIPRDPDLAAYHCCQYLNPTTARGTRNKWLRAGMKTIKLIGGHEFFREA